MQALKKPLRDLVIEAVRDTIGDSILLSGGLDTSIIAAISKRILLRDLNAYTVILDGAPAPDAEYASVLAKILRIPHKIHRFSVAEMEANLRDVVSVLGSFDPMEIRNSVAIYIGLKQARSDGFRKVMTGDAADELFAGYSFIYNLPREKAKESLLHLWQVMHFSSIPLAHSLGMEASLAYLHPLVKEFAMKPSSFDDLVGKHDGTTFGKYNLRTAFEDVLPEEIAWRVKTPIEHGCGTTTLSSHYSATISDAEFLARKNYYLEHDRVKIRDKEHLKYYEIYRETLGPPRPKDASKRICPSCTSNVPDQATFCTTCGAYPI